jgi:hypothetical protein
MNAKNAASNLHAACSSERSRDPQAGGLFAGQDEGAIPERASAAESVVERGADELLSGLQAPEHHARTQPALILAGPGSGQEARHHAPHHGSCAAQRECGASSRSRSRTRPRAKCATRRAILPAKGAWISVHSMCAHSAARDQILPSFTRDFTIYDTVTATSS